MIDRYVCVCVLKLVSGFFVSHLFEVTHSFSLIRHVYQARIGVHHPVSFFSHPAFHLPGHSFSGVLGGFFVLQCFVFILYFLCLLFSISHLLKFILTSLLHGKNPHFLTPPPPNNNSHTRPKNIDPIDPLLYFLKQPVNQFLQHRPRTSLVPA